MIEQTNQLAVMHSTDKPQVIISFSKLNHQLKNILKTLTRIINSQNKVKTIQSRKRSISTKDPTDIVLSFKEDFVAPLQYHVS